MNVSKKTATLLTGLGLVVGTAGAIGVQAFAQQTTPTQTPPTQTVPTTQAQTQGPSEQNDGPDKSVTLPAGGVTEAQARVAIQTAYPNSIINRIELEDNNGSIVYGAKLADKTEVTVDAKTGVVATEAPDQEGTEHLHKDGGQANDPADQSGVDNQKDGETNDDAPAVQK